MECKIIAINASLTPSGTEVVFKWQGSFHNVVKIGSADDYTNCNGITNTAGADEFSYLRIFVSSHPDPTGAPGPFKWTAPANECSHFFVCGIGIHCTDGNMKAAIEVSNNCA